MAAEQLYNKYADIPALEKQTAKILQMFSQVEAGVVKLKDLGININSSKSVGETKRLTDAFDKQTKAVKDQQGEILKLKQQIAQLTTEEARQVEAHKQVANLLKQSNTEAIKAQTIRQQEFASLSAQRQVNKELLKDMDLRLKIQNAEEGSQQKLSAQYEKAVRILNRLSEAQRNTDRGKALEKFARDTNSKLKLIESSVGNFRRNVGNYAGSLTGLFDNIANEIKKLKEEQDKLTASKVSGFLTTAQLKEVEQQLDKNVKAQSELNRVMAIGTQEGLGFQQAVRKIGFEVGNLSSSGNQDEGFINRFKKDAGRARDAAQDLKEEINALGSDTRKLDLAVGALSTFADAFQAVAGASALFGEENEDTQRSLQRLIAIQSVANGIKGVATQLTQEGTAANKVYNAVVKQGTILFGAGATAASRFGAALKLTGIGILITGIGFLITKLVSMGDSSKEAAEEVDKLNEALNNLYQTRKKLVDLAGQTPEQNLEIELLKQELALAEASGASLNKQFQLKQAIAIKEKKIAEDQIDAILKRGDVADQEGFAEMDRYDQILAAQQFFFDETRTSTNELMNLRRLLIVSDKELTKAEKEEAELRIKQQEAYVKLTEDQYNEYTELIKKTADAQSAIETQAAANRKRIQDANIKAAADLFYFEQNLIKEQAEFDAGPDSFAPLQKRLDAVKKASDAEIAILRRQVEEELREKDLAADAIILIKKQRDAKIIDLEAQTVAKQLSIQIQFIRDQDRLAKEGVDDFEENQKLKLDAQVSANEKELADNLNKLEKEKQQEIENAVKNREAGIKGLEDFAKKKEKIELDYQRRVLLSQIDFYEKQLTILEVGSSDYLAAEAALAAARTALAEGRLAANQETIDKEKEQLKQIKENYINAAKQVQETVINVFGAIAERRKTQIQEEINLIEERKAREIEAINSSGDNAEKKAARIKIIEARAQSDREALEKRQRQIERQRAITERSLKAFTIITDTITSINAIKQNAASAKEPVSRALYLSQLAVAIASGAAALTSLLAAPLPKLAKGTKSSDEGLHEIGEQGRELSITPDGKIKMYTKPTVDYLKKGTMVLNNKETESTLSAMKSISEFIRTTTKDNKVINDVNLSQVKKTSLEENIGRINEFIKTKNINIQNLSYDNIFNSTKDVIKTINQINELIKSTTQIDVVSEVIKKTKAVNIDKTAKVIKTIKELPAFHTGVESSPEGFAQVAEKGREIGIERDGKVKIWDSPTISYLKQGTKILPNKVTEDIINNTKIDLINRNDRVLYKDSDFGEQILKELQKKKQPNVYIYNNQNIESTFYYDQQIKH